MGLRARPTSFKSSLIVTPTKCTSYVHGVKGEDNANKNTKFHQPAMICGGEGGRKRGPEGGEGGRLKA